MPSPDLVIVGSGPAGLACAITAAERGARVLLIEKSPVIGGTLHLSTGQMSAAGTRRQRERGIDDHPDRHFAEIMAVSGEQVDPGLLRRAVDEAPRTIDWLEEIGLELDPETPSRYMGHEPYETVRTYWPAADGGRAVLAVLDRALRPMAEDGRVELLLEHRASALLRDADGRISGVAADGPDGRVERHGRAVVLTTGGYGADPALYAELAPGLPRLISACRHTSTGDGLRMGRAVGAAIRGGEHQLQTVGVLEPEPGSGRAGEPAVWANLNPNFRRPLELHVNDRGERFLAEDDPSPDRRERALMAQPDQRCWVVYDAAALRADPFVAELGADGLRAEAATARTTWAADDLATLARRAGIDEAGLERTVADWNAAVETGHDPLGRTAPGPALGEGPYYATLVYAGTVITFGGLACDTDLRVLDEQGAPVPGLYAAGEALGAAALSGNYFWGGMAVTPSLSFGRVLGREAVVEAAHVA